jgi:type VI secretion system protein ImpA
LQAVERKNVDLEFDERFLLVDQLISEHEADFDAPLRKGREPFDWAKIAQDCESLSLESHDLRIAVWWLRARAETGGLPAWVEGLQLIQALLVMPEQEVYPQGDADISTGELHATVLGWLSSSRSVALFKKLPLTPDGEWRISTLLPDALDKRSQVEADLAKFHEAMLADPDRANTDFRFLEQAKVCLETISLLLDQRSPDGGGDFSELISTVGHALHRLAPMAAVSHVPEQAVETEAEIEAVSKVINRARDFSGPSLIEQGISIHSRDEVRLALAALERYYRDYESGHPAPIFINRLQRMVDMSFELLVKELFSESERLLGQLVKPASE